MGLKNDFTNLLITSTLYSYFLGIKVSADSNRPDFAAVLESRYFADKTLIIKDFLNEDDNDPAVKIIAAAEKFGKTTVIDMVKRFFTITVYRNGTEIPHESTDSYKLFCGNKLDLKICKQKYFVSEYQGQLPVIHIDFQPLKTAKSFETLLEQLRLTIQATFVQHRYLTRNPSLFESDEEKDSFEKCCCPERVRSLVREDVQNAFTWLSRLLSEHFDRPVLILLDDYDSVYRTLLFERIQDYQDVLDFIDSIFVTLFKLNEYLGKALLTGVFRVLDEHTMKVKHSNVVKDYRWLADHEFSKYYGFTEEEVAIIISRNVKNKTLRTQVQNILTEYYGGYNIINQKGTIYNMWSVINYFQSDMRPGTYWLNASSFQDIVGHLITNKDNREDYEELYKTRSSIEAWVAHKLKTHFLEEYLFAWETMENENFNSLDHFLLEFGFLTTTKKTLNDTKFINLEMPNKEIRIGFSKILQIQDPPP